MGISTREPDAEHVRASLGEVLAGRAAVSDVERLRPWFVFRCRVTGEGWPQTVVVKTRRGAGAGRDGNAQQLPTEQAALEFLDALGWTSSPRLLASDLARELLVLEDLAPRTPLSALLEERGSLAARDALQAFARALGALHAATRNQEARFYARRRALGPLEPAGDRERHITARCTEARDQMLSIGAEPSTGAEHELVQALNALNGPGPFVVLSNGDPHTNNFLVAGCDGRMIDFEDAGYRHALMDAASLYVPGPLWITVGDPIASGLEDAYRAALREGVPEAEDDAAFGSALGAACLVSAVLRAGRFRTLDQRPAHDDSRKQLVSMLESAARVAEAHRALPQLCGWTQACAQTLRRRWPEADVDFSRYGSYAPRVRRPPT